MKTSIVICTYKRPIALERLLQSIIAQTVQPDEILVIDSSPDNFTGQLIREKYPSFKYYLVGPQDRGLTKQRNFGVLKTNSLNGIVLFLDDDTVLKEDYIKEILLGYKKYPDAIGIGGYIINEAEWVETDFPTPNEFACEGFARQMGSRNLLRKKLGLLSKKPPGVMPKFSNGLSISFLPPTGKVYPVEFFMGGVASYKREIFKKIKFSRYFEGYGLYEDMDFCLRASKLGQLYVNTAAQLIHLHEDEGRPNNFRYGKMVIRNGWYVWRLKYPKPGPLPILKWHTIAFLLTLVRIGNVINTRNRKEALTESFGRIAGWVSLFYNKPKYKGSNGS